MHAEELILFTRRLSLFLRAGIPINRALDLITKGARRGSYAKTVAALAHDLLNGKRLSDALEKFPRTFDPLHVSLIRVGEASGTLSEHLEQVAQLCTRRRDDRRRLMAAAAYPAVIVCAAIALTLFLVLYAFPKILPLFRGFHHALPFSTRMLIAVTDFATHDGWIALISFVALIGGILFSLRFPTVRGVRDRVMLRMPLIGMMMRNYYSASVTRTLSTLLQSGIGILPAFAMLARGIRQSQYEAALVRMGARIEEGRTVSDAFNEQARLFPSIIAQLVHAGEQTGTLPESLRNAAQIHEYYLEEHARLLSSLLEPALMIVMGCIVGFVALAIITPIYGITQVI